MNNQDEARVARRATHLITHRRQSNVKLNKGNDISDLPVVGFDAGGTRGGIVRKGMGMTGIADELENNHPQAVCKALGQVARVGYRQPEQVKRAVPALIKRLADPEPEICSRACWAVGQVGFRKPEWVQAAVSTLARLTEYPNAKVREKAIWALGRIGRAKPDMVKKHLALILSKAGDQSPRVRLSVIWTCENIATQRPEWFAEALPIFIGLLDDPDARHVRREAPEILRVLGKRRPEIVECAIPKLTEKLSDKDRVVRIHAQGALNAIRKR